MPFRPLVLAASAAGCLAAAPLLHAQPFEARGAAGGWSVFYNGATGGCFIEKAQGPLVVQLGTEAGMLGLGADAAGEVGENFGFIAVYTDNPEAEIEHGAIWPVVIEIDGDVFAGEAKGVVRGDVRGGYIVSSDPTFAEDIARGDVMNVVTPAGMVVEIDLTGTRAAIEALTACQRDMSQG